MRKISLDFEKIKDEVELMTESTGISVEYGRYIRVKWEKGEGERSSSRSWFTLIRSP
ncbi:MULTISPECIES: hypothetical protein [Metallosphaera]|uniref:hypothetical protein n=1 Tax=Metallosphaera TaxID=41980 RepID=UPI001F051002|nr:hypothetical protein [Metallosphaera sedula]MCH1770425.1 hypothetical protein [Metallosphaera sedula]